MKFTQIELPSFLSNLSDDLGIKTFAKYLCDEPNCSVVTSQRDETGWILSIQSHGAPLDAEELETVASRAINELLPENITMTKRGSSSLGTLYYQEEKEPV